MLVGSLATLALAILGMGVWALVWGNLLTIVTRVIGLNTIAPGRYRPRFSLSGMKHHFRFGRMMLADNTLWFVFSEFDKFIAARLFGAEQLGYYAVSQQIATLPINKLAGLIKSIAFAGFSEVQTDAATVRTYLLTAMRIASIVVFPVFFGLAAVADELVPVVLGDQWAPATTLLKVLAFVMPLRMIVILFPPVLWGIGRPDVSAGNWLFAAVFMPAALVLGAVWGGITGLAVAWLCAFPVVFFFFLAWTARLLALPVSRLLRPMALPALASLVMLLCVEAFRQSGTASAFGPVSSALALLSNVLVGVLIYGVSVWTLHRDAVREMLAFLTR
jgi:O-antigen/teichoic acid export membrane protein